MVSYYKPNCWNFPSRLFGDDGQNDGGDANKPPMVSPSAGWAKLKESNPDEFRTPTSGGPGEQRRRGQGRAFGRQQRGGGQFGRAVSWHEY